MHLVYAGWFATTEQTLLTESFHKVILKALIFKKIFGIDNNYP